MAILSVAEGSGLYNAEAGVETGFTVQAKDIKGNLRTVGTDDVEAVMLHEDGVTTMTVRGVHQGNGLYRFRYTQNTAGMYVAAQGTAACVRSAP